jgi:excinuclease ABC subunit B
MKKKPEFIVKSPYQPAGDQPKAIEKLSKSILDTNRYQTLEGVTGSGKTHTMARIIENVKMPTIIMTHNKTLAAQLYSEFRQLFHSHTKTLNKFLQRYICIF